ncbi:MAG: hypothetical protein HXX13_04525 [Bacteroidetes bacterium]|nr:hypothetical protein [Bacteroidota bacterium]
MKPKIFIIGAVVLLLLVVGFMIKDLFIDSPGNVNPYAFDLNSLRKGDTSQCMYSEDQQIKPAGSEIHGISTDASGNIYISGKDTLEKLDSTGKVAWIKAYPGNAECIHVDEKGNIFLGMEDHIELLDANGTKKAAWNSPSAEAVLTSIATSGKDVFVADAGNKLVYRYDYLGNIELKIGQKDPSTGVPGFIIPSPYFDLAMDPDGSLWVANTGRHELEKYTREGKLISSWGKASMEVKGFCGCCNPSHFAIFPGGFVTAEKAIERVKIYDMKGNFVCLVALPESFEEGTKGLDLAIGAQNAILVLDPVKNLVRKFIPKKKES